MDAEAASYRFRELALPVAALWAGASYYLAFRDVSALRIGSLIGMAESTAAGWSFAGAESIPSLLHVLAFSLLTIWCLPQSRAWRFAACGGWLALASLAEVLQLPSLQSQLWYLPDGRFDPLDLCGNLVGASAAYLVGSRTGTPSRDHTEVV